VRDGVIRALRQAIVGGKFLPGQYLSERQLAVEFKASRPTIREALRQLEAEGFVKPIPTRGIEVVRILPQEARDLYEVREALEGMAGRLFAERADQTFIERLRRACEELQEAVRREDVEGILNSTDRVYDVIFEGAGNRLITRIMHTLHARIKRLRYISQSTPGRIPETSAEFAAIFDALTRRDPDAAEIACRRHVRSAAHTALQTRWLS
jgi:DNA-binding GntR family transcriptional regulator